MKVFSIRHGEQLYPYRNGKKLISASNAPLVELGKQQIRDLKIELDQAGINLDAVYRSPLLRAEQSAQELVGEQSTPIYVVNQLKEGFPDSAFGKTYDDLEEIGGDIYAHPFNSDQELLDDLVNRSREALRFILQDAKECGYTTVAIVGHGDPLCALDWVLKHEGQPRSYAEMEESYYPQKAQAKEYIVGDESLRLEAEGRLITTEASQVTVEGFRNSPAKEAQ